MNVEAHMSIQEMMRKARMEIQGEICGEQKDGRDRREKPSNLVFNLSQEGVTV